METFLKGEALITEFEIRVGETIARVYNEGKDTPMTSLRQFLINWSEDYNEDSVLFESFNKFIHKVLKKVNTLITSEDQKEWINEQFKSNSKGMEISYDNGI